MEQVFAERAARLARAKRLDDRRTEAVAHLGFRCGGTRFAVASETARRVLKPQWITRMPFTPPHLSRVTQVEGRVVAILDLRVLIGATAAAGAAGQDTVLVLERGGRQLGLFCDGVDTVEAVQVADLGPPPARLGVTLAPYVRGVTGDMILVLEVAALISGLSQTRSE
jgi:chemotaxis signal transduction protein